MPEGAALNADRAVLLKVPRTVGGIGIDELELESPTAMDVELLEQRSQFEVCPTLHESKGRHVCLEPLEGLHRQIGETVKLPFRQVKPVTVSLTEKIEHTHDGKHHRRAPECIEPASVSLEHLAIHHRRQQHEQDAQHP